MGVMSHFFMIGEKKFHTMIEQLIDIEDFDQPVFVSMRINLIY